MLCVCFKKDELKFERDKVMMETQIANEEAINEIESLIDGLQKMKVLYAEGKILEHDRQFKLAYRRFHRDLASYEKVKDWEEVRLKQMKDQIGAEESKIRARRDNNTRLMSQLDVDMSRQIAIPGLDEDFRRVRGESINKGSSLISSQDDYFTTTSKDAFGDIDRSS